MELGCHGYMECDGPLAVGCYSKYTELKAKSLEIRLAVFVVHQIDLEVGLGTLYVCMYIMCVYVCTCVWCVC